MPVVYLLALAEYPLRQRVYGLSLIERLVRQFREFQLNHIVVVNSTSYSDHEINARKDISFIKPNELSQHIRENNPETIWLVDAQTVLDDRLIRFVKEINENIILKSDTGETPLTVKLSPSMLTDSGLLDDPISRAVFLSQLEQQKKLSAKRPVDFDSYIDDLRLDCVPYFVKAGAKSGVTSIENLMYEANFKGTMDFIATYIYKYPVREITKWLSRYSFITPNFVTTLSILTSFAIPVLFALGYIGWAILAGWTMFILDSVDGKLARLTVRLSKTAGIIEHATSSPAIFFWFVALGWFFSEGHLLNFSDRAVISAWTLMILYWTDKAINGFFRARYKRDLYDFRRIDRLFHLVACRRAVIMLIITIGYFANHPREGFYFVAVWMIVTFVFHLFRYFWIRSTARS